MSYVNPDRCDPSRPDEALKVDAQTQGFIDGKERIQREAILRGVQLLSAIYEGVKTAAGERVPEGTIYAIVMGAGYSLDQFNKAVSMLEERKMIRRSHYRLFIIEQPDKVESGLGPEENH